MRLEPLLPALLAQRLQCKGSLGRIDPMGHHNPNIKGHHSKVGADRTSEPLMLVSMRQWT